MKGDATISSKRRYHFECQIFQVNNAVTQKTGCLTPLTISLSDLSRFLEHPIVDLSTKHFTVVNGFRAGQEKAEMMRH